MDPHENESGTATVVAMKRDELDISIRDHVLLEADPRGKRLSIEALVVKIAPDELWLGLPEPDPVVAWLHGRQPLRLSFSDPAGARLGHSAFRRILAGDPPRIISVDRPQALEVVQRRMHHRYELDAPVRFRQLDPITREPRGRSAAASTVNVSLGGMLLRTSAFVAPGAEMDLTLPLGGGDHITTTNRVVRVKPLPLSEAADQPLAVEIATQFTRITSADQDMLLRVALAADRRRRLSMEADGAFAQ
jgi:hypothetical protein